MDLFKSLFNNLKPLPVSQLASDYNLHIYASLSLIEKIEAKLKSVYEGFKQNEDAHAQPLFATETTLLRSKLVDTEQPVDQRSKDKTRGAATTILDKLEADFIEPCFGLTAVRNYKNEYNARETTKKRLGDKKKVPQKPAGGWGKQQYAGGDSKWGKQQAPWKPQPTQGGKPQAPGANAQPKTMQAINPVTGQPMQILGYYQERAHITRQGEYYSWLEAQRTTAVKQNPDIESYWHKKINKYVSSKFPATMDISALTDNAKRLNLTPPTSNWGQTPQQGQGWWGGKGSYQGTLQNANAGVEQKGKKGDAAGSENGKGTNPNANNTTGGGQSVAL